MTLKFFIASKIKYECWVRGEDKNICAVGNFQ